MVESGRLLTCYTGLNPYRGFKSLPLRKSFQWPFWSWKNFQIRFERGWGRETWVSRGGTTKTEGFWKHDRVPAKLGCQAREIPSLSEIFFKDYFLFLLSYE